MTHSHVFDVSKRAKLNSEERRQMLTPDETLKRLGYKEGLTFADIGCGTGLFTFPAAEIGGKAAEIFAVDVSQDMLDDIRAQVSEKHLSTVITVKSDAYDFKLNDSSADFILICTVLHEIEDKKRFLAEAKRISAEGAKIAVIDFNEKEIGFGPPLNRRVSRIQVGEMLTDAGFSEIDVIDVGDAFYAVTGLG